MKTDRFRLTMRMLLVYFDGFRAAPGPFLQGVWWRIIRKRVRARGRLSPLIGRSPQAYRFWSERQKIAPAKEGVALGDITIAVIIDATDAAGALSASLSSLANPERAIVLDRSANIPGSVASLDDISPLIDWEHSWLLPIRAGDMLEEGAENHYMQAALNSDANVIYADDDELISRRYRRPHFKPQWNAELFHHHDYISGACIVKADQVVFNSIQCSDDWIADLVKKTIDERTPQHLPAVLHHRRVRPDPEMVAPISTSHIPDSPAVSVIIPTRNGTELLRTCLDGLSKTDYPNIEIIIVDNDSDDETTKTYLSSLDRHGYKILKYSGPFNYSAINNAAVLAVSSPILCFLNNDIEILHKDWLSTLVQRAMCDGIGAVGPMLLYPDGTVQHAGIVLGVGGGAAHAHRSLLPESEGYFRRHLLPQFVSAVTGACLVVTREKFDAAGGFNEIDFPVAFNDVDLCLKLSELGHSSFYEPRVRLVHHESKSRGNDRDVAGAQRLAKELKALKRIWNTDKLRDPYHHPSLSPYSEQFVIDL